MPERSEVSGEIEGFFQNTTIHGLPRIQNGSSLRKLYWATLFTLMFAILIFNVAVILQDFYSYPTYFKNEKSTMPSVSFPSVTLCNSNTFKKSDNNGAIDNTELLINFLRGINRTRGSNKISILDLPLQQSSKYFEIRNGNTTLLNRNKTHTPSFLIEKLRETCLLGLAECGPTDFSPITPLTNVGTCYTFNTKGEFFQKFNGAVGGLLLILYINQSNYLPFTGLSNGAGVTISIHSQSTFPLPVAETVFASTGSATAISIDKTTIYRKPYPYKSNCTDGKNTRSLYPGSYTILNCQVSCYYLYLYDACGYKDPVAQQFMPTEKYGKNPVPDVDKCVANAMATFFQFIRCDCPLPCEETKYRTTVSSSRWPSTADLPIYKAIFADALGLNESNLSDQFTYDNFLQLRIYFDELSTRSVTEVSKSGLADLLGALGGVMGLWIGASVFSVAEVLALFTTLGWVFCCRVKAHNRSKTCPTTIEVNSRKGSISS